MSSTSRQKCPLDGRRDEHTVWLKLLLAHLVTLLALTSLYRIRYGRDLRRRFLVTKLAQCIIFPLFFPLQKVLGGIGFILASFYNHLSLHGAPRLDLARHFRDTFGIVENENLEEGLPIAYKRQSSAQLEFDTQSHPPFRVLWVYISFIPVAYPTASIIMFIRRRQKMAVTFADLRVFELAISCLCASIQLVFLSAQRFTRPARQLSFQPNSKPLVSGHWSVTHIHIVIRMIQEFGLDSGALHWFNFVVWYNSNSVVVSRQNISFLPRFTIFTGYTMPASTPDHLIVLMLVCSGLLLAGCLLRDSIERLLLGGTAIVRMLRQVIEPAIRMCLVAAILLSAVMMLDMIAVLVADVLLRLVALAREMDGLRRWPVDKYCPLLWTDPASNFVWNLI